MSWHHARANLRALLYRTALLLEETPQAEQEDTIPVYRVESDPRAFQVARTAGGWRVSGAAIERAASMTYWEYSQSVRRFQVILKTLGVEEALRRAGIKQGDAVFIGEYELEWSD